MAGERNRTLCENRGRRRVLWTLRKRWQACVIRRIAFYVAGAGNSHHGSYVLMSKGSIPEKGCIFGTSTGRCFCVARAACRMTPSHAFVASAVLLQHVSIFVEVSPKTLVLEVRIFSCRGRLAENARFGSLELQFLNVSQNLLILEVRIFSFRGCLGKRSCWKSGSSIFANVSQNLLLLEIRIFSFQAIVSQKTLLFPLGAASRTLPRSPFHQMLPQPPLQKCDRSHHVMDVTAVTASRMLPPSPLQRCYRSHRFKNVAAVTASRTLLFHRFKNVTALTASRMLPQHRSHGYSRM